MSPKTQKIYLSVGKVEGLRYKAKGRKNEIKGLMKNKGWAGPCSSEGERFNVFYLFIQKNENQHILHASDGVFVIKSTSYKK